MLLAKVVLLSIDCEMFAAAFYAFFFCEFPKKSETLTREEVKLSSAMHLKAYFLVNMVVFVLVGSLEIKHGTIHSSLGEQINTPNIKLMVEKRWS